MKDTVKAQVMTMVKKMIDGKAEHRRAGKNIWERVGFNASISSGDLYGCLPVVSKGVETWQRTGSVIQPKHLLLRGVIAISNTEAKALGASIRLIVAATKGEKSYLALNTAKTDIANNLLDQEYSFNTAAPWANKVPYDGSPMRHTYPLNKEMLHVYHDKHIHLFSSYGENANQRSSDDTRRFIEFALKVPCPKKLTYEDDLDSDYPTNWAPFVCLGYTYPDGTDVPSITTPVVSSLHASLVFEDM